MAAKKTVTLECDAETAAALGEAIAAFAQAAYPPGGSECAQVARETLLDTARACFAHRGGPLALRRRQLGQLRSAVDWYFEERPQAPFAERLRAMLARPAD